MASEEIYAGEVSPSLISDVAETVVEEVRARQSTPLNRVYPTVSLDAWMVKIRQGGPVENGAAFAALGVNLEGNKKVPALWTSATEGAKLWWQILTELRDRGVQDVLIACVDRLREFPDAV
ncbi:MAG TPA: transposase, partial [Bryobacteraceae bacterium]